MSAKICLECGTDISEKSARAKFCGASCRQVWNNRRMERGRDLYDLFMSLRYDRQAATDAGVWNFMCRLAQDHKSEDDARRGGRRSWDSIAAVKARNVTANAVVVNYNAAGVRRR